jgi:hypothetical protein
MTTLEVLQALQARDIRLTVHNDQLVYDAPEGMITEEVLMLLRQHKTALMALLQQAPEIGRSDAEPSATVHTTLLPAGEACLGAGLAATTAESSRAHPGLPMAPWERPGACFACGDTRRWRSVYGAVVCARCHPPADAAMVAAWLDGDTVIDGDAHDLR